MPGGQGKPCVTCDRRRVREFVVRDVTSGFDVGELCRFCARDAFGESLQRGLWKHTDGCAICERDGHLAIVAREPRVVNDGERRVVSHELASEPSMLLCNEHAHGVLSDRDTSYATRDTADR